MGNIPISIKATVKRDGQTRTIPKLLDSFLFKEAASVLVCERDLWSDRLWTVRGVEADADLLSLGSERDCVLPLRDSSFPKKPGRPYDEPACV